MSSSGRSPSDTGGIRRAERSYHMHLAVRFVSTRDSYDHPFYTDVVKSEFEGTRVIVAADVPPKAQVDHESHPEHLGSINEILETIDDGVLFKGPATPATYRRSTFHNNELGPGGDPAVVA